MSGSGGILCRSLQKIRTEDEALANIVVGPGWQAASAIIGRLEIDNPGEDKAGNCLDPEEEAAISQPEIWLQAWARKKDSPKDELELLPHSWQEPMALPMPWQGDERYGGPTPKCGLGCH